MNKKQFRGLVVFWIALGVFGSATWFFFPNEIEQELTRIAQSMQPVESQTLFWAVMIFLNLMFIAGIAGTVGLLMFRKWGRVLSVVSCIGYAAITPIIGVQASSGISLAFDYVGTLLTGAIIALAYFSDVSKEFK